MKAKNLNLEELEGKYLGYCTVGDLLKFIEDHDVSKDSKILVERVEDFYYEKNGWETVKKQGDQYNSTMNLIDKAKNGVFSNKKVFPRMTEEVIADILKLEEQLSDCLNEYHPVWSPVLYSGDDNLYLDLHY